jgi:LacI family transcriptional regulator
VILRQSIEK